MLLSLSTGQTVPASCDANFCPYCAPRRASSIAKCISLAEPERAIVFTGLTGVWATDRNRKRILVQRVRAAGYRCELAWHVEPNPKDTGYHSHDWQHGDYIPQRFLQDVARSVGFGIPLIQQMRQKVGREGHSVGYGLKGVRYGMKHDDLDEYLDLNGARLVHGTRGFWRDGLDGERLTLETARERVRTPGDDEGPWVLRAEEPNPCAA